MSSLLDHAAAHLLDTLTAENAALARLDLVTATALLPQKMQAAATFASVLESTRPARLPAVAARLNAAAADNRTLLERAMAVQTRVLGIIAQAAQAEAPRMPTAYGKHGARAAVTARPWALCAQA